MKLAIIFERNDHDQGFLMYVIDVCVSCAACCDAESGVLDGL